MTQIFKAMTTCYTFHCYSRSVIPAPAGIPCLNIEIPTFVGMTTAHFVAGLSKVGEMKKNDFCCCHIEMIVV